MPTIFKKSEIVIKDRDTGEYNKFINVIAEKTTKDMVDEINKAGTAILDVIPALPTLPLANGTYMLIVTIENGDATYGWQLLE